MFDVLFVALLQAAAGEPAPAPTAQTAPAAESTAAAPPAEAAPDAAQEEVDPRHVRRCRTQAVTGSRLGVRVCSTEADDDRNRADFRRTIERMQGVNTTPAG